MKWSSSLYYCSIISSSWHVDVDRLKKLHPELNKEGTGYKELEADSKTPHYHTMLNIQSLSRNNNSTKKSRWLQRVQPKLRKTGLQKCHLIHTILKTHLNQLTLIDQLLNEFLYHFLFLQIGISNFKLRLFFLLLNVINKLSLLMKK